jgi:hypothetical protein
MKTPKPKIIKPSFKIPDDQTKTEGVKNTMGMNNFRLVSSINL